MIKGVNKKVIEINHPDSAYFERAVLYLKPDVKDVPPHAAQMETLDYFPANQKQKKTLPSLRRKKSSPAGCCFSPEWQSLPPDAGYGCIFIREMTKFFLRTAKNTCNFSAHML